MFPHPKSSKESAVLLVSRECHGRLGLFVRFMSVEELPVPTDPALYIKVRNSSTQAVLGPFGGFPDDTEYHNKWLQLKDKVSADGLAYDESTVIYEGYSSPFEFRDRKQEVHVQVFPAGNSLAM